MKTAVPRTRPKGCRSRSARNTSSGTRPAKSLRFNSSRPLLQVVIVGHDGEGHGQRDPAAIKEFEEVGAEIGQVEQQKNDHQGRGLPQRPAPDLERGNQVKADVRFMVAVTAMP